MDRSLAKMEDALSRAREEVSRAIKHWAVAAKDPSIDPLSRVRLAADIEAAQDNLSRAQDQRDKYLHLNPSAYGSLSHWGMLGDSRF